jgi:hypothetical protein
MVSLGKFGRDWSIFRAIGSAAATARSNLNLCISFLGISP